MIEERILKAIEEVKTYNLLIENEHTYIQVENFSDENNQEPFLIQKLHMQKHELKQQIDKALFMRSKVFTLEGVE